MGSNRGKVIVAMSGGVDSSVAACLLHEQGYDVTGLFMRTGVAEAEESAECRLGDQGGVGSAESPSGRVGEGATGRVKNLNVLSDKPDRHRGCCSAADASDARVVAGKLGIPFFALNFKEQFDRIIDYFAEEYQRGRTPNPCVMCNEHLKFGRLADYGVAAGSDFIATGHYARIDQADGAYRLRRGVDAQKDQSYVLFGMGREILPRTLLPIGGMSKDEVREHARRFGLSISEKPDSVDICFVPDRDYAKVVRERRPEAFVDGPVVDVDGKEVGRHGGVANFTIGQRRGLGIAMGSPVYVTGLDAQKNVVTVGKKEALASDELTALRVSWLIDPPVERFRAHVQIRYAHKAAPAVVEPHGDCMSVRFDEPQTAITPGQVAVIYDGDVVLGGGWID